MVTTVSFPGLGLEFELNRVAFSIGGFNVYWYGLLIGIGFMLAGTYALLNARKVGVDSDRLIDVVMVGLVCGVIGARLYYVIFDWETFQGDLSKIFDIRQGGLAIYGGILAGMAGGIIMAKIRKVRVRPAMDLAAAGFLIGQGIGRWGNFFNQEAFGRNTDSFLGMSGGQIQNWITNSYPYTSYYQNFGTAMDASQPVHPCFLYESIWCLLGFVLLALFAKKIRRYDGQIFLLYIGWYGLERAFVEGLRADSLVVGNVRISQMLAILCVVASVILQIVIGLRVKRMGVDYRLYKDTAESKALLAEYDQQHDKSAAKSAKADTPADDTADSEETPAEEVPAPESESAETETNEEKES